MTTKNPEKPKHKSDMEPVPFTTNMKIRVVLPMENRFVVSAGE